MILPVVIYTIVGFCVISVIYTCLHYDGPSFGNFIHHAMMTIFKHFIFFFIAIIIFAAMMVFARTIKGHKHSRYIVSITQTQYPTVS
jgi:hypothetical protein